jgi:hypothetical protein
MQKQNMKTERKQDFIQLTKPETVQTNRRILTKAERYRLRDGVPTIFEMGVAKSILSRLATPNGVMEMSQPENIGVLRWAFNVVANYE